MSRSPTTATIEQRVRHHLEYYMHLHSSPPELNQRLVDELGLDSMDLLELCMDIEDEFRMEISDAEAEQITTVQQIIDFVKAKVSE